MFASGRFRRSYATAEIREASRMGVNNEGHRVRRTAAFLQQTPRLGLQCTESLEHRPNESNQFDHIYNNSLVMGPAE